MASKKNKKNKSVVEVMKIKFDNDIQKPNTKEDKRNGIIKYGDNNLYPDFLLNLFIEGSSTHSAIINRKISLISGQGFKKVTSPELITFIKNNRGSNPLGDIVKLSTADYEVFNAFAIMARWNDDKTLVAAIDYVPVHKVRKGIEKNTWFTSDNWKNPSKPASNTLEHKEFNANPLPTNFDEYTDDEKRMELSQIVYFKRLSIGSDSYPNVSYSAAIRDILSDSAISDFTLNQIKTNFLGGYHLHMASGIPEPEEMKQTKEDFVRQHTGENAQSVVLTFGNPEDKPATLTPLPSTNNQEAYLAVGVQVTEKIMIAHSVTDPQLFGIRVPGALGGRAEQQESLEIFQSAVIRPIQSDIENVFNRLASVNKATEDLKLAEYSIIDKEEETTT